MSKTFVATLSRLILVGRLQMVILMTEQETMTSTQEIFQRANGTSAVVTNDRETSTKPSTKHRTRSAADVIQLVVQLHVSHCCEWSLDANYIPCNASIIVPRHRLRITIEMLLAFRIRTRYSASSENIAFL
jgi:hypothetical protein